jgi:hypothetical protein
MTIEIGDPLPGLHDEFRSVSVWGAARFAYRLLGEEFAAILRLLWLPLTLSGLSLYLCIQGYFQQLLIYLATPDPKAASLALALLALGSFLALFFWSIAVSAVTDLALGVRRPSGWWNLRAQRQEWRLFAGYLRFLFLAALLTAMFTFALTSLLQPWLAAGQITEAAVVLPVLALLLWFAARVGFLMPPIVATTTGMILRASWRKTENYGWRIAGLILILLLPTFLIHALDEIVLSFHTRLIPHDANLIANYARHAQAGLAIFIAISTVAYFFAITLLTAGAVALYRQIDRKPS